MKILIAISCLLAVASAGILNPALHTIALQPQHIPVIGPNGVPLEPAANVAARAVHAAAHIEANARNGNLALAAPALAPLTLAHAAPLVIAQAPIYAGPQHLPVIGPNGVPLEPAENVARRTLHQAAHVEATIRNGDNAIVAPVALTAAAGVPLAVGHSAAIAVNSIAPLALAVPQHIPVIGPNGVPLEPAANVAARALHAASHIEAKARNGDLSVLLRHRRGILGAGYATPLAIAHTPVYVGPQHIPIIGPNGVPLEPAENVAARAVHAAAHVEANARNGALIAGTIAGPIVAPIGLTAGIHPANTYPVLNINGQPLETPEVAAARAAHIVAHAEANARNNGAALLTSPLALSAPIALATPGITTLSVNGLPVETPEVAAARAAHIAAHINVKAAHGLI